MQRIANKHQKMTTLQAKMLGASISNHPAKVNDVPANCCTRLIMRLRVSELEIIEGKSIANAKFAFSIKNPLTLILSASRSP
jgi:hypothetical protein